MVDAQNEVKNTKPVYRNIGLAQLIHYRLPWAGKVSILHRISGAVLFLMLPFILYLLDQSLASELSYQKFQAITNHILVKIICLGLIWCFLHHFCAGIRYLLLDLEIGVEKSESNRSAIVVFVLGVALTAAVGLKLFGLY
ncbi:succinate dehydrogenase, cytochrome b556 subunit [Polynucleobacter sphagniphilus]|jgi:succinate dehydrogenase / fumarate reductase cytochrome b subunit|uniref:Succinate dehydrogenase cytochrome b556 subunit n=1 Tax=Polynucleobacter sphagniphilus TaxID=1743169 RepID=A0AA43S558_9BURK|nr:succinate dehydrogenase, cytochrome b556 subunit [Polynucleobacter sphagniphilus]MDF9787961.1 succinate dehydrogenase / fumarate reductase cytochrome b subunit [Polynucleobacter sphagniphilus]MDH6155583.1 succinate dehydrogenase / fumarate reductase cytochrome b subunit [Polynucleobacter sphagniphilus]MDH6240991.1 succinate dehydrogenase / fumarate reductase cytochrome b subunit [Polynucleobacter sphagniphilus]MDH6249457.1 succinate dehydrogenase / fumarate reductase cytochrome b subunit [Po